jgi:3-oxoacyl-[acyl-carrier-protein] synthase II
MRKSTKRVAVTGIGSVSPLGNSFDRAWDAIKAGRSGISKIKSFDASGLPWRIAGELKDFDESRHLSGKEARRLDPFVHYAIAAAGIALEDAGLTVHTEYLAPAGVVIGSSRGGISTIERELVKLRGSQGTGHGPRCSPFLMPATTISMAASYVAQRFGVRGHCLGISNACASGTNAMGEAFRAIKSGNSKLIIAGGSEAPICRLCIEGYGTAGALSRKVTGSPRPFDRDRDGFVLSEGACLLVLEDYEQAMKRGAAVYGEVIGYGNTSDAFHMTKPHPEGEAEAMRSAIKEAGLRAEEVDYISTHGTGTRIGDSCEALAIKKVFGKRGSTVPASAIKSSTGHMLAASGAFEIAATLKTMKEGIIPPTINMDNKDAGCEINIVTKKKRADIGVAISNSFGFGGVNAVIVLKRLE